MKSKIKLLKQEQKERAQKIRSLKSQRKTHVSKWYNRVTGYVPGLDSTQHEYRVKHIVYCLLRGRKPQEIENRWRNPENPTNVEVWKKAESILRSIYEKFEIEADKELVGYEAIRANSK